MITGYIYIIHNTSSNKVYVGQTAEINPNTRWLDHKCSLRHNKGNKHLRDSWNKYGEAAFDFTVIDTIYENTITELKQCLTIYENAWVQFFNLCEIPIYNSRISVESNLGFRHSLASKTKISTSLLGKPAPNKGIAMSSEQKIKIAVTKKGKPCRSSTKFIAGNIPHNKGKQGLVTAWNKGIATPVEIVEKLSLSHIGQKAWNKLSLEKEVAILKYIDLGYSKKDTAAAIGVSLDTIGRVIKRNS